MKRLWSNPVVFRHYVKCGAGSPVKLEPTKDYQMYFPKGVLLEVSRKKRIVAQNIGKVWYLSDTKSGKKSIFFRGWINITRQNPLFPKRELLHENRLISGERLFRMLENNMHIIGRGQAVLNHLIKKQ